MLVRADVAHESEVREMIRLINAKYGRIDLVINNAGANKTHSISAFNLKDFQNIMNVNLLGSIFVTKYALPLLKRAEDPRIIFVGSMNYFVGSPYRTAYNISKSGLIGLTRSLATELAPKICVNAVIPGYINTEMLKKFSIESPKKRIQKILLGRLGKPDDVANVVSFLCSKDSSYITGQCIHVNGGAYFA